MEIISFIQLHEEDILEMADTYVNWTWIPFGLKLQKRVLSWWESWNIAMAYNMNDTNAL